MSNIHFKFHYVPDAEGHYNLRLPKASETAVIHLPEGYKLDVIAASAQDEAGTDKDKFLIVITNKGENVQKNQTE